MGAGVEVHGFGGFRSGGGFNIDTDVYERLSIDDRPVFGAGFGYSINEIVQVEFIEDPSTRLSPDARRIHLSRAAAFLNLASNHEEGSSDWR